jgi:hypothetical protein
VFAESLAARADAAAFVSEFEAAPALANAALAEFAAAVADAPA